MGVGSTILEHTTEKVKHLGYTRLTLWTEVDTKNFYGKFAEKRGIAFTENPLFEDALNDIKITYDLETVSKTDSIFFYPLSVRSSR
jgi:hypothetical protein